MPGFAATEVQITGVLHEYSTIEGVQEDVVEILLNLKNVALRMHAREETIVRLHKKGAGPITAGDIDTGHDVEVVNPDLVIAHLNKDGELNMTLKVARGRGYQPAVQRAAFEEVSRPIGRLQLDASFSPIRRVRKPAASGMPRKISTVRATSQTLTSKPWVSRPSQPGSTVK